MKKRLTIVLLVLLLAMSSFSPALAENSSNAPSAANTDAWLFMDFPDNQPVSSGILDGRRVLEMRIEALSSFYPIYWQLADQNGNYLRDGWLYPDHNPVLEVPWGASGWFFNDVTGLQLTLTCEQTSGCQGSAYIRVSQF